MHDIGAIHVFITFIGWYFIEYLDASMTCKINQKSHSIILNKCMHDIGAIHVFITFIGWYFIEYLDASMTCKINQKSH